MTTTITGFYVSTSFPNQPDKERTLDVLLSENISIEEIPSETQVWLAGVGK